MSILIRIIIFLIIIFLLIFIAINQFSSSVDEKKQSASKLPNSANKKNQSKTQYESSVNEKGQSGTSFPSSTNKKNQPIFTILNKNRQCYLNSAIQFLYHSKLKEKILQSNKKEIVSIRDIFTEIKKTDVFTKPFDFTDKYKKFLDTLNQKSYGIDTDGSAKLVIEKIIDYINSPISNISFEQITICDRCKKMANQSYSTNQKILCLLNTFNPILTKIDKVSSMNCFCKKENIQEKFFYKIKKLSDMAFISYEFDDSNPKDFQLIESIEDEKGKKLQLKSFIQIILNPIINHYIAYVRVDDQWYMINDSAYTLMSREDIFNKKRLVTMCSYE